jgi:hypothetical protein
MSDIKKTIHKAWRRVAEDKEVRESIVALIIALTAIAGTVLRRGK